MNLILEPKEIQNPFGQREPIFCGTLGRCEWEAIAGQIIGRSIEAGKWVAWKPKFEPSCGADGMEDAGFVKRTENGLVLTDKAKLAIYEKYPAKI